MSPAHNTALLVGAHLGPFQTPVREDDPGHLSPEFNLDQQRYLVGRQAGASWTWSAMRPSVVCGTALGNPMNLVTVLAVYATLCTELGGPMRFPGRPGAYDTRLEMTDAGLLARATMWAAPDPAAANQAFNITNGDLFRWNQLWPHLADLLEVPVGPPLPMTLTEVMADKQPLWEQILADSSKARRHGFTAHIDTRAMFTGLIAEPRTRRIIP